MISINDLISTVLQSAQTGSWDWILCWDFDPLERQSQVVDEASCWDVGTCLACFLLLPFTKDIWKYETFSIISFSSLCHRISDTQDTRSEEAYLAVNQFLPVKVARMWGAKRRQRKEDLLKRFGATSLKRTPSAQVVLPRMATCPWPHHPRKLPSDEHWECGPLPGLGLKFCRWMMVGWI